MAITTVILGATMAAMNDAIKVTESAQLVTDLNNGLRTSMDLMVRDLLQVGQGLPSGRLIVVPSGAGSQPMQLPGPVGSNFQLDGPSFCPPDTFVCPQISAVIPGPGRGPEVLEGQPTDMIDRRCRQRVRPGPADRVCRQRLQHHRGASGAAARPHRRAATSRTAARTTSSPAT